MKKYLITRMLINIQINDLLNNTIKNLQENGIDSIEKVRNYKRNLADFSPEMKKMHKDLKNFLYTHMYKHYKVIRMEEKARMIITELFMIYVKRSSGVESILPPNIRKRLKNDSIKRVIADYIAGMTDREILDEYKKFFDPYEKV